MNNELILIYSSNSKAGCHIGNWDKLYDIVYAAHGAVACCAARSHTVCSCLLYANAVAAVARCSVSLYLCTNCVAAALAADRDFTKRVVARTRSRLLSSSLSSSVLCECV